MELNEYLTCDNTQASIDTHAINIYMDKEANSVKTFTSANVSINSANSSYTNDTRNSMAANQQTTPPTNEHNSNELNTITSTLLQIKKTISVLDANVKNNNQESEEILGKLIVLENYMNQSNSATTITTTSSLGTSQKSSGQKK